MQNYPSKNFKLVSGNLYKINSYLSSGIYFFSEMNVVNDSILVKNREIILCVSFNEMEGYAAYEKEYHLKILYKNRIYRLQYSKGSIMDYNAEEYFEEIK